MGMSTGKQKAIVNDLALFANQLRLAKGFLVAEAHLSAENAGNQIRAANEVIRLANQVILKKNGLIAAGVSIQESDIFQSENLLFIMPNSLNKDDNLKACWNACNDVDAILANANQLIAVASRLLPTAQKTGSIHKNTNNLKEACDHLKAACSNNTQLSAIFAETGRTDTQKIYKLLTKFGNSDNQAIGSVLKTYPEALVAALLVSCEDYMKHLKNTGTTDIDSKYKITNTLIETLKTMKDPAVKLKDFQEVINKNKTQLSASRSLGAAITNLWTWVLAFFSESAKNARVTYGWDVASQHSHGAKLLTEATHIINSGPKA